MRPTITRAQAVQIIAAIANKHGITDAFTLYDDAALTITLDNLGRRIQTAPPEFTAQSLFVQWVEEELGIFEPSDPHEIREFEMSFR
jgi:hypothetical protein